jgi:hypothetical protein
LISRAFWAFPEAENDAERASAIGRELGDAAIESSALDALGVAAFRDGDFKRAYEIESSRFRFRPQLNGPDLVHDLYLSTIPTAAAIGRLDEAARLADELTEVVAELTPHHRLHGAACRIEIDELRGAWEEVLMREEGIEHAVLANRDTPCVRNSRSLLVCALAHELVGNRERAGELEELAEDFQHEGHGYAVATPHVRLALVRERLDLLEELLSDEEWFRRQRGSLSPQRRHGSTRSRPSVVGRTSRTPSGAWCSPSRTSSRSHSELSRWCVKTKNFYARQRRCSPSWG